MKQRKSKIVRYSVASVVAVLFVAWGWWMLASPAQYLIETPTQLVPASSLYTSKLSKSKTQVYVPVDKQIATTKRRVMKQYQGKPAVNIQKSDSTSSVSAKNYRANLKGQTVDAWSTAEILALKLSHTPYTVEKQGVQLSEIAPKQATGKIAAGDQLVSMNHQPITSAKQFNRAEQSLKSDQPVALTVHHRGQTITEKIKPLQENAKDYHLGMSAIDKQVISSPAEFRLVKHRDIVGPSYSLMAFTQMYFDLTDTGSRLPTNTKISGTGQVTSDGRVMPVSGIKQKVYAAGKQGVTDFYVPNYRATKAITSQIPNYQNNYTVAKKTAKKYHLKMTIHPVTSVYDVIGNLDEVGH